MPKIILEKEGVIKQIVASTLKEVYQKLKINPTIVLAIKNNELILKDNQIIDFFEKEVTPHGTGGKIPCSSKYIGKKAYVIIKRD